MKSIILRSCVLLSLLLAGVGLNPSPRTAHASTGVLPAPTAAGLGWTGELTQEVIDKEFFRILQASGMSTMEICFEVGVVIPDPTPDLPDSPNKAWKICEATLATVNQAGNAAMLAQLTAALGGETMYDTWLYHWFLPDIADQLVRCGGSWWLDIMQLASSDGTRPGYNRPSYRQCLSDDSVPEPTPPTPRQIDLLHQGLNPYLPDEDSLYLGDVTTRVLDQIPVPEPEADGNPEPDPWERSRTLAQECVTAEKVARSAGVLTDGDHPSRDGAVFFPGADAGEAAEHDLEAIVQNPAWAYLTYRSGPVKQAGTADTPGVPRTWYDRVAYSEICPKGTRDEQGLACDEYPFYTTVEGGPGASLRLVNKVHNSKEGNGLVTMYNDLDCAMAKDSDGVRTNPGDGSTRFLVVPVATRLADDTFAGPPTFHLCGARPVVLS